jgi:acetyl esterase/lipase
MRDRWVAEIRELWGKKAHPSLNDFPEVEVSEISLPSLDAGIDVPVTLCTPPGATAQAFVYLHGGGWIAPASGKHIGWAKRVAALSGQTVAAVHYRLASEERHPCASPAHGDFGSLPQTLVIVGEDDTLCDDGVDFAKRALSAGASVQLHIGEKMPHGFHMQHSLVPQAAAAAEQVILAFLKPSSF